MDAAPGQPDPTIPPRPAPDLVPLRIGEGLWERVFTVAPLVLVGTREGGGYDFAPKHMAMPLGWEGFYCFVCSPQHSTYANVLAHRQFTVSFPRHDQMIQTALTAAARSPEGDKPTLAALPTIPAQAVDGRLVSGCLLYLECELERVLDGFGPNSLVIGRVLAASAAADALRDADRDDADLVHRLGLVAYLAPGRFGIVRESRSFPYPAGFRL